MEEQEKAPSNGAGNGCFNLGCGTVMIVVAVAIFGVPSFLKGGSSDHKASRPPDRFRVAARVQRGLVRDARYAGGDPPRVLCIPSIEQTRKFLCELTYDA